MEQWGPQMSGQLVLAQMDTSPAVAYANYGAGRSSQLATLARDIRELGASLRCTLKASFWRAVFTLPVGTTPWPTPCTVSPRGRNVGASTRAVGFGRSPAGTLICGFDGQRRRFGCAAHLLRRPAPSGDTAAVTPYGPDRAGAVAHQRLVRDWAGTDVCLLPGQPSRSWHSKSAGFEQVLTCRPGRICRPFARLPAEGSEH